MPLSVRKSLICPRVFVWNNQNKRVATQKLGIAQHLLRVGCN